MRHKTEEYIRASQRFINTRDHLNCSIALSYYAVFFYMQFLLVNMTESTETYESLNANSEDSHTLIKNKILTSIKSNNNKNINKRITELHSLRIEADYRDTNFSVEQALDAKDEAEKIIADLKYFFNNDLKNEAK